MKRLVDEIIAMGNELRQKQGIGEVARAHLAPSKKAYGAFTKRHAATLPRSYLELLSIYDGVDNFEWVDVSLLSTSYILAHPHRDETWIESEHYREGELFIFASSPTDSHDVAFLLHTARADGEMDVIHFDAKGPLWQHESLEAYLHHRRLWFMRHLA
jgi:hypothetical protein